MRFAQPLLLGLLALALIACKQDAPEEVPPVTEPDTGREGDPELQNLHSVHGFVTSGGSPLAGATLTVVKTGKAYELDSDGGYRVSLDPGDYEVTFSAPGHRSHTQTVTVVEAGTELNVDLPRE